MKHKGFTVVEIMVVIVVIAILVTISIVGYGRWRYNLADSLVKNDVQSGGTSLMSYRQFKNNFPPNLAGTGFVASPNVALVLYTDAPSIGVYQTLSEQENAQLLLNVCNANIFDTPNTACVFSGNGSGAKIHVKGTGGSNIHWNSPIQESAVTLPGSSSAAARIITQFKAQGGTFPVVVRSSQNTALPEPTKTPNGPATRYCLEGRAAGHDITYHASSENTNVVQGPCPSDPDLHYYK